MIACQMSLYPLATVDFGALVTASVASLRPLQERGLTLEVGAMSTVVTGPDDLVWEAVRTLFDAAAAGGQQIVLTATLSNECGCDVPAPEPAGSD